MIIAIWIFAFLGLVAWSLVSWGLYALLSLDPAGLDDLKQLVDRIPFGELLSQWLPGWQELLRAGISLTQSALGWVGGAARLVVWVVWAVGALLLAGSGGLLTLMVVLLRDKPKPATPVLSPGPSR